MDPHFDGVIFQTYANELQRRMGTDFPAWCAVDVRSAADYAAGHLPGSRSVTLGDLSDDLPEGTDAGTEFFVIGSGPGDERVRPASEALRARGARRVVELAGGVDEWKAFDFPLDQAVA